MNYPTYYGRNLKTGEVITSDTDGKNIFLKINKDKMEHYYVKTQSGRLSAIVNNITKNYGIPKFVKVDKKTFDMFKRFIDTGNVRYLNQAEQMM